MKTKRTNIDVNKLTFQEMRKEYERLSKRANVRLKALEDKGISSQAYSYIERQAQKGKGVKMKDNVPRFERGTAKLTIQQLRQRITTVQDFLNARTSTIKGIKETVKDAYNTFIEKAGIDKRDLSIDDYANLWSSEIQNFFERVGGSGDAIELIVNDLKTGSTIEEINAKISEMNTLSQYKQSIINNNISGSF